MATDIKKLAEELSNNRVEPSQVILTTFTELAATEFREKAREQILAAKNLEAAAQLDSAVIGTVHSMAYHFIKKFWYLLDYGADIQTISERDDEFYMSQSLARIVQEEANKDHLENASLAFSERHLPDIVLNNSTFSAGVKTPTLSWLLDTILMIDFVSLP